MYIKLTRVNENIVINNETLETILRPMIKESGQTKHNITANATQPART